MNRIIVLGIVVALLICCFVVPASAEDFSSSVTTDNGYTFDFDPRTPYYKFETLEGAPVTYENDGLIYVATKVDKFYCQDLSSTDGLAPSRYVSMPSNWNPESPPVYSTTSQVGSFNKRINISTGFYELPYTSFALSQLDINGYFTTNYNCTSTLTVRFTLKDGSVVDYPIHIGNTDSLSFSFSTNPNDTLTSNTIEIPVNTVSVRLFVSLNSSYAYNGALNLEQFYCSFDFVWNPDRIVTSLLGNALGGAIGGFVEDLVFPDNEAIIEDIEQIEHGIFGEILGGTDLFPSYIDGAVQFFGDLAPALLAVVSLLNLIFGIDWLMGVVMVSLSLGLLAAVLNISVGIFGSIQAEQEAVSRENSRIARENSRIARENHRKSYEYYRENRSRNEAYSARYKAEKEGNS